MAPGMNRTGQNQRKKTLINPGFQWRQAIVIALVVFASSMIISALLYDLLHKQARLRASNPTMYTAQVTTVIIVFSAIYSAVTALGVGLWSLMATHRICGPLHVMRGYLTELASGCLPRVRPLRRRDEFKEVHRALATAVDSLRKTSAAQQAQLADAIGVIQSLQAASTGENVETLKSVTSQLDSLRAQLCEFCGESASPVASPKNQSVGTPVLAEASV